MYSSKQKILCSLVKENCLGLPAPRDLPEGVVTGKLLQAITVGIPIFRYSSVFFNSS